MSDLIEVLTKLGFKQDPASKKAAEDIAVAQKLSASGAYTIQDVLVRDDVIVTIEQNHSPEDYGNGMTALVSHPALAVMVSPRGRVAFNPQDTALAVNLVNDLA